MRIFFAGATGVIGARVLPRLIATGHEVTAVARSQEKAEALRASGATPATVDLFDDEAVARAVDGCDVIINCATHIPPSNRALLPGAWSETDRIRKQVPKNLVRAAQRAGVKRLIQESFAGAYADRGAQWIDEDVPLRTARYNRGVGAAEEALERFRAAGGEGVTLRFAYFYGRDSDFTRDVIATVRKGWAPTPGTPDAYVSSVSHDDAAAAVIAALQLPAGTYNVCDDEPVTHRDYFASLARLLEIREPRFAPEWTKWLLGSLGATLARSQRMSNKKLRATGLWTPALPSIREGWSDVLRDVPAPPVT